MYVIAASWTANPGEEEAILSLLRKLAAATRLEPGNIGFSVHRSVDNATEFLLYEQYKDAAAFDAHVQTAHFKDLVLQQAIPRLQARERRAFVLLQV